MSYKIRECIKDDIYRYSLKVETDSKSTKKLIVIQCNPSNADANKSDATVGKVSTWAEEKGFNEVIFLNLFAFISSNPEDLKNKKYEDIVGSNNNSIIEEYIKESNITVVLAWGDMFGIQKLYEQRLKELKIILDKYNVKPSIVGGLTQDGYPRHGKMWNKGYRELSILKWSDII